MNANDLYKAPNAIQTLISAGLITARQARKFRSELSLKLNEAIEYYNDKGFVDVVEGLNAAWKEVQQ